MRILITGSRRWADGTAIVEAIVDVLVENDVGLNDPVTIVHGAASGADHIASVIASSRGAWTNEAHPADWKLSGKRAGGIRNQHMVDLGADICLAFPLKDSIGTWDCMRRALEAGIPVKNYGYQGNE